MVSNNSYAHEQQNDNPWQKKGRCHL